jgi:ABC-type nickel/cobalt efflux system permease component RcnA
MTTNRSRLFVSILLLAGILFSPAAIFGHPMGNFSISHYSAIAIERDLAVVRYLIDMAEIPTFQEIQEAGIVAEAAHPTLDGYLARRAEELKSGLTLEVNGKRLWLQTQSREILFTPGAGALPTMKIGVVYRAALTGIAAGAPRELIYTDNNFADRAGWKEVVATKGPGIAFVSSSAPAQDRSRELSDYPTDLLNSPPQNLQARVVFALEQAPVVIAGASAPTSEASSEERNDGGAQNAAVISPGKRSNAAAQPAKQIVSGPAMVQPAGEQVALRANRQGTPKNAFTELIANRELGWEMILIAALVAAGLGALHALEPGHGKTIVAAYLVGSRGTPWHALLLGLIVTASHTAGVYLLGAVTLYASRYVVPERLYPWLGVFSGLTIAGLGIYLLLRRRAGGHHHHSHEPGHHHVHGPGHGHGHEHEHDHDDASHSFHEHIDTKHGHHHAHNTVSLRDLIALGITGGIIPCPAALVVLLSAVALGRIGLGLLLIVAFSLGLAAVLIALGILIVSARRFMATFQVESQLFKRWLPRTSALIIALFGIVLAAQALKTIGIL